jgi:hypothetical protein
VILLDEQYSSRGPMRGPDERSRELFSYVDLEQRVRADHPLRAIRELTDSALAALSEDFAALYSGLGRPSIAPEMLLRAMLLQAFYSVSLGAATDGAAGVRFAVPVVRGSASTMRYGITLPSRRTETGCWTARSRPGS